MSASKLVKLIPCMLLAPFALAIAYAETPPTHPIRLAVFDFELEDFSAAAGLVAENPADRAGLQGASLAARQFVEESSRYALVDMSNSDVEAVRTHVLRQCNGCESQIAKDLGADQSLLGVITRISQTEYQIQLVLRDSKSGALILRKQSDLRMGANYSWGRGVASFVRAALPPQLTVPIR